MVDFFEYSKRDLNPHSHHWPKDFKSFVSTDSTIRAVLDEKAKAYSINTMQRYKIIDNVAIITRKFTVNLHYYEYHT